MERRTIFKNISLLAAAIRAEPESPDHFDEIFRLCEKFDLGAPVQLAEEISAFPFLAEDILVLAEYSALHRRVDARFATLGAAALIAQGELDAAARAAKLALWLDMDFAPAFVILAALRNHVAGGDAAFLRYGRRFGANIHRTTVGGWLAETFTGLADRLDFAVRETPPPRFHSLRRRPSGKPGRVLFACEAPQIREAKIAEALARAGWQVDLAYQCDNAQIAAFDAWGETRRVSFTEDLNAFIAEQGHAVMHTFVRRNYCRFGFWVAAARAARIVDIYDIEAGIMRHLEFNRELATDFQVEKYLLDDADGGVYRCLRGKALERAHFVETSREKLFFPDYIGSEGVTAPKLSDRDGQLHVVLGGSMSISPWSSIGDTDYGWLCRIANRIGFHLHIYPTAFAGSIAGFRERVSVYGPFCHVHDPLPYDQWLAALATYDAGIIAPRSLVEGWPPLHWTRDSQYYAPSNRFADFIEAQILFVGPPGMAYTDWAARRGIGIRMSKRNSLDPEFWTQVLTQSKEVAARSRDLRKTLVIDRQIGRLAGFYHSLGA